jgi:signal transduction histidine kinase
VSRRRRVLPTVIVIILLLALPAAAVVQYVWLADAREGESARLHRSLENALRQVWTELTLEISGLPTVLPPEFLLVPRPPDDPEPSVDESTNAQTSFRTPAQIATYVAAWYDQLTYPEIVQDIYLVDRRGGEPVNLAYQPDTSAFEPLADPQPDLETFDSDLGLFSFGASSTGGTSFVMSISSDAESSEVGGHEEFEEYLERDTAYSLIVSLNQDYLATDLLPQLVQRYLGDDTVFNSAVVDESAHEILYSSVDVTYDQLTDRRGFEPDEVMALSGYFSGTRQPGDAEAAPDLDRMGPAAIVRWMNVRRLIGRGTESFGVNRPPVDVQAAGLYLYVWHTGGNIERATAAEMRWNLMMSYAVLLMLAGVTLGFYFLFRRAIALRDREHEFVASVTHELRTPIAAMHAVADNLADGIVTGEKQVQEYGRALLDESRRLRTLVDHVLLYAGLQGSPHDQRARPVDIEAILATATGNTPGLVNLHIHCPSDLPSLAGDPVAIEAVATNLLGNAVKHNDPGTKVVVSVRLERLRRKTLLVLDIRDAGIGIPRDELRRIREPFYRGAASRKRQVPGTGLGLSLVQRIADACHGSVAIESQRGRGTTVVVRFPVEVSDG